MARFYCVYGIDASSDKDTESDDAESDDDE